MGQRSTHLTNVILHNIIAALVFGKCGGEFSSVLLSGTATVVESLVLVSDSQLARL